MAQRTSTPARPVATPHDGGPARPPLVAPALYALGIIGLLIAMGASGALIYKSFTGAALAGCGAGSGCDQVYETWAGKVPGTRVSVSVAGFAFFLASLVWWALSTGGVSAALRWWARLGAAASVFYIIVMLSLKSSGAITALCAYCLAAHIGNFVFVAASELRSLGRPAPALLPRHALAALVALVVVGGGLAVADQYNRARIAGDEQRRLDEEIARKFGDPQPDGNADPGVPDTNGGSAAGRPAPAKAPPSPYGPDKLFTGRYIYGPENARARIVVFSDYQCPDCKRVEQKLFEVLHKYPNDVNFSARHSPMDYDCNVNVRHFPQNKHPSACEAAYLAEAAGMLGGDAAFYAVHEWLFSDQVQGRILASTPAGNEAGTIHPQIYDMAARLTGLDAQALRNAVTNADSNGIASTVARDVEEAQELGLYYTPMVFVNGKQVKAFRAYNYGAIEKAVEAVLASGAVAKGPGGGGDDRPPLACDKFLDDFYKPGQTDLELTMESKDYSSVVRPHPRGYRRGPSDAAIEVHFWGDFVQEQTRDMARALLDQVEKRGDTSFVYHHYVFNNTCNTATPVVRPGHENACIPALALEAAGVVGGEDAFWAMFEWLIDNTDEGISEDDVAAAAESMGLSGALLRSTMQTQGVRSILNGEGDYYKNVVGIQGLPGVVINGQRTVRVELEGCPDFLDRLLDRALEVPRP